MSASESTRAARGTSRAAVRVDRPDGPTVPTAVDRAVRAPTADARTFLAFAGVRGGSTTVGHEDEIDVHGVRWGVHVATAATTAGSGRRRSRVEADEVVVTAAIDRAAPALVDHVVRGRVAPTARLSWIPTDGSSHAVLALELENVQVSSFRATSAGSLPAIEVTLEFESARFRVTGIDPDGSAGDEVEVEFDLELGT